MLQHEVAIEQDGFDFGQKRIIAVDMRPARLHHADLRSGEVMDHAHDPVFRRHEVSVEDGDEFPLGGFQAFF